MEEDLKEKVTSKTGTGLFESFDVSAFEFLICVEAYCLNHWNMIEKT
jgi:hypothetical protein